MFLLLLGFQTSQGMLSSWPYQLVALKCIVWLALARWYADNQFELKCDMITEKDKPFVDAT